MLQNQLHLGERCIARATATACVCLAVLIACSQPRPTAGGAEARVVGVPDSRQGQYPTGGQDTFVCLDGTAVIDAAAINDDYCDCPGDGSDEPGTSACANGRFYCINRGHLGQYIPSSRVSDGVCDCCDGSDESSNLHASGAQRCANTCEAAGAAHRLAQSEAIRVAEAGARAKQAMVAEGAAALADVRQKLEAKRTELEAAKATLAEAEALVTAEEELERADQADREANQDDLLLGALGIPCKTDDPVAEAAVLRDLLMELVRRADASESLVDILNERAKAAYKAEVEAFNAASATASAPPSTDPNHTPVPPAKTPPVPPVDVVWPEESVNGASYVRPSAKAAREARDAAESVHASLNGDITQLERQEAADYGPDAEWWPLRARCVDTKAGKYTYSVCPYKEAKQDHTRLGSWKGWEKDYSVMVFADGASCWNGPKRSLRVTVECGAEEWLGQVEEPSTCTYTAHMKSPAACDLVRAQALNIDDLGMGQAGSGGVPDPETRAEL